MLRNLRCAVQRGCQPTVNVKHLRTFVGSVGVNKKRFAASKNRVSVMKGLFGASLTIALAATAILPAAAASLPEVKVSNANQVPACATPGRLMAYMRARNPSFNNRFDPVATYYMRHGEELGVRWDVAFFQMVLETGALSYTGDVRADQNNFAGLGASGRGKRGERFADISSGVKAHLQHLLMYAGEYVEDPVAERTRKVQEWGILTKWQNSIGGPMTYGLIAQQWAPGSKNYTRDMATISEGFYAGFCNQPDPRPELVQEARKGRTMKAEVQTAAIAPQATASTTTPEAGPAANQVSGAEIAQQTIASERKEERPRAGLGAQALAKAADAVQTAANAPASVTLLNPAKTNAAASAAAKTETPTTTVTQTAKSDLSNAGSAKTGFANAQMMGAQASKSASKTEAKQKEAEIKTALAAGAAKAKEPKVPPANKMVPPANQTASNCKVWTASYGGQRAILIKAAADGTVNYTVLDVNAASEKREVDAYIAAYAKGGEQVGAFSNQAQALDKAFQLCPEG